MILTRVHLDKEAEFERVLVDYQEFCRLNGSRVMHRADAPPRDERRGKDPQGSVDTYRYSAFVYAEFRSSRNLLARQAAMRYHADADCEGAARYSRAHLLQTLLKIEDLHIRRMCLILWLTGLRPIAVRRLRRKLFAIAKRTHNAAVTVQIRWDKTGQKRVQRRHLQLPWEMVTPLGENGLRRLMGKGPPDECPYVNVTCDMINATLHKVASEGYRFASEKLTCRGSSSYSRGT